MTGSERPTWVSEAPGSTSLKDSVAHAVRTLGARSEAVTWSEIPDPVRDRVLLVVFDTLGVMMAGAATAEVQALADCYPETGNAPLVGLERWAPALDACSVNGAAVCSLELDEGSKYARGHPAAHVIPAALACGDHDGTSWLAAVLAGYEVAARFGRATRLHRGVHPHGTWGATGAATVAARLAGLDADGVAAAIDAAAGLSLAPHFESALTGHPVRNMWVGSANASGLMAARLAEAGADRVDGIAADTYGDLIGAFDPGPLVVPFEERFEIMGGYFKRHAACAYTHSAADAVLLLLDQRPAFALEDVESVIVETYRIASTLARLEWPSRLAAMFSIPYVVSVMLLEGSFGPAATDERHRSDSDVRDLAGRVAVVATDEFERRLPDRRGARVSVRMRDGSMRTAEVEQPVGDGSGSPFGWEEIRSKLGGLMRSERVAELEESVRNLESQSLGGLLSTISRS